MAMLGLDVGGRRIGVALAAGDGQVAIPLTTVERARDGSDIEALLELARGHGVERIVVGLPRSLDGTVGRQAEATLAFVQALAGRTDITVDTWDERLTSVAAGRLLSDAGLKGKKGKARRDAMAAALILQGYIDRTRTLPAENGSCPPL
ncbi:MAG: Holliday junction resolvase RuvX [Chloroflexota bacterium]|nr:Holliday junction resolvase RuvX [Chloroflexota bacterium]